MDNQPSPLAASRILDEQFLTVRSKLIDLAATFDRLDRAVVDENGPSVGSDPRIENIQKAVEREMNRQLIRFQHSGFGAMISAEQQIDIVGRFQMAANRQLRVACSVDEDLQAGLRIENPSNMDPL